ncbi:MAG: hypothetical protein MMC23_004847 [Stictis urceolatum]|nr:hypothetical protein [Stictis urceolata]
MKQSQWKGRQNRFRRQTRQEYLAGNEDSRRYDAQGKRSDRDYAIPGKHSPSLLQSEDHKYRTSWNKYQPKPVNPQQPLPSSNHIHVRSYFNQNTLLQSPPPFPPPIATPLSTGPEILEQAYTPNQPTKHPKFPIDKISTLTANTRLYTRRAHALKRAWGDQCPHITYLPTTEEDQPEGQDRA